MAEYEALLSGLRIAIELGVKRLNVRGDSQLVIDQVMKESSCHDPKMEAYCKAVRRLVDKFDRLELDVPDGSLMSMAAPSGSESRYCDMSPPLGYLGSSSLK